MTGRPFREPGSTRLPVAKPVVPPRHGQRRRQPRYRPSRASRPHSTTGSWLTLVGCALGVGLLVVVLVATGHAQVGVLLGSLAAPALQLWATYLVCLMASRRAARER